LIIRRTKDFDAAALYHVFAAPIHAVGQQNFGTLAAANDLAPRTRKTQRRNIAFLMQRNACANET
jgi:hypothetical protein